VEITRFFARTPNRRAPQGRRLTDHLFNRNWAVRG